MASMKIALVGATGAVGREILKLLEKRSFPVSSLRCFATKRSAGSSILHRGEELILEEIQDASFDNVDLAFFAAGSAVSKEWIPTALRSEAKVVDSSSAFRMDPDVPLVIPEINPHALKTKRHIASPNCAATILLLPLYPLHKLFRIKRIVASTYQAASGAGYALMQELQQETKAHLENRPYLHKLPVPYAFNLFLHNSALHESGYSEEERKIRQETCKILEDETIQLTATCVRVPVLRAHSVSANIEFHRPVCLNEARQAIASMPGVNLFEDFQKNRFPTPFDATGQNDVLCGRLRLDPSQLNTLEMWCVGDQLLKGAALNAVQIAELLI